MKLIKLLAAGIIMMITISAVPDKKPTLFTIGDSTMAENNRYYEDPGDPGRGWVQGLGDYFDPEKITIKNLAVSGRSSKSYIDEGRWQKALDQMKTGDYLLIQFGHNDAKKDDPKRFTDPETTFKDNLRMFVEQAREKGVTPVIATSVVRRYFNKEGGIRDSHGRYVPAAAEVAAEMGVALIDMNSLTGKLVAELGPESSKALYLYVEPGVAERFPEGNVDDTHLNLNGAAEFSKLFAAEVAATGNPLAAFLLSK